ncbi:TPA: type IV secretory system conjugative DNA transfer family protein [Campylobacter fetus subsp. venerealis]|nr:type IV secretory system conjugative DNA transfer family protein [Campylobacter fetus subsp. venerealis]HDX8126110.1 type IV secretory system conjugative DNA transfer family protein [Campylobacter fetus subsp. venerealis]HDX8133970.1 type IV secretory system conjugative DNA transfer family protein [Campylobacter fetus subsp. venerealis]HDX8141301.1 type IV secretory system conjugative DNA transfer family protein [Campylobacter fetus subsp. venerealis]
MKKDTNQTLVYILAISGIVISFIVLSSFATQYLARSFNYSKDLGEPLFYGLYNPFNWIFWSLNYQPYYPDFFTKFLMIMQIVVAAPFLVFIIIKLAFLRKAKAIKDLHGSAHWATIEEVKESGVFNKEKGVYIGGFQHEKMLYYLRHDGPEHVMVFAPTRSGKGVSLLLPTLLSWEESALIFDIKAELWSLTAGWRQKYAKNKVLKLDPTCLDDSAVKFNILEEIRIGTLHEIKDAQNIAINLIFKGETPPTNPAQGSTAYFKSEGGNFLVSIILYALHLKKYQSESTPNLTDIYKFINDPNRSIDELLEEMVECDISTMDKNTQEIIQSISRSMKNKAAQELSGVIGTASDTLNLYIDPILAKNTAKSDFKIKDLMNHDSPISLYLIIPPGQKNRLRPFFNLLVNQIFRTLTDDSLKFENGENIKSYKHKMLVLADELTIFGKLGVLEENLAYMAGYGMKFYGSIQDIQQLYSIYGEKETIISNCHVRIAFAPNKVETAKLLSEMSGITTIIKKSLTSSGKRTAIMLGNVSETLQEVQRPLITADECMRLPSAKKDKDDKIIAPGDMLIFIAGQSPIYGKQILYFKDDVFSARSKVPLKPNISDKLN